MDAGDECVVTVLLCRVVVGVGSVDDELEGCEVVCVVGCVVDGAELVIVVGVLVVNSRVVLLGLETKYEILKASSLAL